VTSKAAFQQQVAAAAAALADPQDWLLGIGWNEALWGGELPSVEWFKGLEEVLGERPVLLRRMDSHMGLVNAAAMRLAGVGAGTVAPPGGIIDVDEGGQPTGILR
jgi:predicted amidohydrolase YtcJ